LQNYCTPLNEQAKILRKPFLKNAGNFSKIHQKNFKISDNFWAKIWSQKSRYFWLIFVMQKILCLVLLKN